jgi:large conductance mechanosensitive channel
MSLLQEFKAFAVKGNVVDLAVGVIIGTAFGKIVSSLVADIIMPALGMIIGGINFTDLKITLAAPIEGLKAVTINYGTFLQTVFEFIIIAFSIFMAIKALSKLQKEKEIEAAAPAVKPADVVLLEEIRDLLKNK